MKRERLAAQISEISTKATDEAGREDQLERLQAIDAIYVQHQSRLEQRQSLEKQQKEAERQLEALDRFAPDEPKPYSFLLLESLHDQLAAEKDRAIAIRADVASAHLQLTAAHEELDSAEDDRKAAVKENADHESTAGQLAELDLAVTLAKSKVGLKQVEVEVQELLLGLCETRQKQLDKKIEVIDKDDSFSLPDRDKQLQRLAAAEAQLKAKRRAAESNLQQIEADRRAAIKKLTESSAGSNEIDLANARFRQASDVYQNQIVLLDTRIEHLGTLSRSWKRRYQLANGEVSLEKAERWLDEIDEFLDQLSDSGRSLEQRRNTVRTDQTLSADPAKDNAAEEERIAQQARLLELRELTESSLDELKANQRMLHRFRDELAAQVAKAPPAGGTFGLIWHSILDHEVATVGERTITVGKVLVLLAYIVGGVVAAYLLTRLIGRRLLPYLGMQPGRLAAIKSILFYLLCVCFGVLAFRLLDVPLAAFAFLGGAAAIAVGFGSQDIMNNFMSGIILLTEQPIRVGDVVKIGSQQGIVMHIGLRSTRLQTDANYELIVPNKSLLTDQVTNLTLSDNLVRTFVAASLDRDIMAEDVKWKMVEIAFAHPLVLKSPRPIVLLKEFDPYWITFEVHFWVQQTSFIKVAMIQSDIMEAICDLYNPEQIKTRKETATASTEPAPVAAAEAAPTPTEPSENTSTNANGLGAIPGQSNLPAGAILKQFKRIASTKAKA